MQNLQWISLIVLILVAMPGRPETVYVGDSITIGLYQQQSLNEPAVQQIPTGTPLNVISRDNDRVQVETADGVTGWVENKYLMPDLPARVVVDTLREENDRLKAALEQAEPSQNQTLDALYEKIEQLENEKQTLLAGAADHGAENALSARLDSLRTWRTILIGLLLALVVGIVLGIVFLDHMHRRRHGGFRI